MMKKTELFFTFVMLPVDIVMIVSSFLIGFLLRGAIEIGTIEFVSSMGDYIILSLYTVPVVIGNYALSGLYNNRLNQSKSIEFYGILSSNTVSFSIVVLALFFSQETHYSRFILLATWTLSIVLVITGRLVVRSIQIFLLKYGVGVRNTIILGVNDLAKYTSKVLKDNKKQGYNFIGALSSKEYSEEIKVIGKPENFASVMKSYKVEEIVICDSKLNNDLLKNIVDYCTQNNVTIKYIPALTPDSALRALPVKIGFLQIMEIKTTPLEGWGRIIKRFMDIFFSVFFIILLSPLMLIIALIQKITSSGPILYSHERVGRDEKKFVLYKFRSMYHMSEDKEDRYWTKNNDNRITPFGKLLRSTNIDELPQLYNILIGDMSFVGPRPEQPQFVNEFGKKVPDYLKRHKVKSGLTGWAQVHGLKGDTSIKERARYDVYYVENWSILLDIKIICMTLKLIIYELLKGKYEYRSNS